MGTPDFHAIGHMVFRLCDQLCVQKTLKAQEQSQEEAHQSTGLCWNRKLVKFLRWLSIIKSIPEFSENLWWRMCRVHWGEEVQRNIVRHLHEHYICEMKMSDWLGPVPLINWHLLRSDSYFLLLKCKNSVSSTCTIKWKSYFHIATVS